MDINDARIEAPDDDAYDLVMSIALGEVDLATIASTLAHWHDSADGVP